MADADFDSPENVATRVIVLLLGMAALLTVLSISVITIITHNFYAAGYYTLSSLFDANSEGSSMIIASLLKANVYNGAFDAFMAISIFDGLAKAVIIGFLIAAFINLISGIDITSTFNVITTKRLKGHVIVGGYSMLAERLCKDLEKDKIHFVVIEKDPEKVNLLKDSGYNAIEGDFTKKEVLENASLKNAKAVVFATESDFINLLGIVTAHHLYPEVKIISRAKGTGSVTKMQRAGAGLCLVPEAVAGLELGESIAKL